MVGVPCFFLCQEGPISKMVCPYFNLCSHGIIHFPETAEITNAKASAIAIATQLLMIDTLPLIQCINYIFKVHAMASFKEHHAAFLYLL